ncbi:sce7726 family protein [Desulforamulus aquiferis]|uniref:Sce7726 family protein n=1 Tax=Desulforamulus aquiferis TaxID=1397668 RepID=A0AAW7ZCV5_9FIRM|nr:sce7726 family protein [Desulforamulus aquiferis]MDO7787231.1 sce7726 family protein [Desulforamulus aquiferis]
MKTRDIDVREKLHEVLSRDYLCDDDTIMVDELGLCQGEARIDIAIINGSLHGYEIKSDSDTLERLPRQVDIYNKVLDTVTIVTGKNHIDKVVDLIPPWWGIKQAEKVREDEVELIPIREPGINPKVDPYSLVQLLWKEEALELLTMFGFEKGYVGKSRRVIWKRLAESITLHELQFHVRQQLKLRENWRVAQQQS